MGDLFLAQMGDFSTEDVCFPTSKEGATRIALAPALPAKQPGGAAGHRDDPGVPLGVVARHLAHRQGIQSIRDRFREVQANARTTIAQIFNAYSAKCVEGKFLEVRRCGGVLQGDT